MKSLYTESEFKEAKSRQLLPLQCLNCGNTFYKPKHNISANLSGNPRFNMDYCSNQCRRLHLTPPVMVFCHQCKQLFAKQPKEIKKSNHHFCSKSCAAKWNNTHKTKGTRISKLEKWLQTKLPLLFPYLEFHFNRKDAINGELDIFIPSLRLAFELNGIFHYEPIYGKDKLAKMQNNDARKMQACIERGIELCIIDVSVQKYFKEQSAKKFLTIIQDVINLKNIG